MRWISLDFIFCHSLFWPICYSLKKNRFAVDACVPLINIAVWSEELCQVQQERMPVRLGFLGLLTSHCKLHFHELIYCTTTSISDCQLGDYIRVFTATRWVRIFQPSALFLFFLRNGWQSVPSSIRLMAALQPLLSLLNWCGPLMTGGLSGHSNWQYELSSGVCLCFCICR